MKMLIEYTLDGLNWRDGWYLGYEVKPLAYESYATYDERTVILVLPLHGVGPQWVPSGYVRLKRADIPDFGVTGQ